MKSDYGKINKDVLKHTIIEVLKEQDETAKSGNSLAGVPFAVQNNICIAGAKLTCGSNVLSNYVSPYSATVIEWLKSEGAVPVCTVNLEEFGLEGAGSCKATENVTKPDMMKYYSDASISGAAALVASDYVPLAIASDAGGGTRMSSACHGVIGMKPSYRAYSRFGLTSLSPSMEQIGLISKDIPLLRAAHRCLSSKKDPMDATHMGLENHVLSFSDSEGKIAVFAGKSFSAAHPTFEALQNAECLFANQGYSVQKVEFPFAEAAAAYYVLSCAEISASLARITPLFAATAPNDITWNDWYRSSRNQLGKEIKDRITAGAFFLQKENYNQYYLKALAVKKKICDYFRQIFEIHRLIITPVFPSACSANTGDFRLIKEPLAVNEFMACANLAGLPAIAIPLAHSIPGGLIAIQCIAPIGKDEWLLDAAEILMNK